MRAALSVVAVAVVIGTSVGANARFSQDPPVYATLRLEGERKSFKTGEPIRLELLLTADKPGFVVDTAGADDPSDVLSISPEDGVHRLKGQGGRDYQNIQNLSATPTVIDLAANYWARFDRPGTYTVAVQTRRASAAGANGWSPDGRPIVLKTNGVTFRIEPTSIDDEQQLISAAGRNLQSSITLGLAEQIRAAEELAFLPGDAAAIEKYRWYRELGTHPNVPGNARGLLVRGFLISRNPAVILGEIEAELRDVNVPVTFDLIANAASLAVAIKYPSAPDPVVPPVPSLDSSDPFSIERARYLKLVHDSLSDRTGLVKLQSAGAMLDMLVNDTPADVVRLIVEGFQQFPIHPRIWFASGRWEVIRDTRLGPILLRTLDEVELGSRSYIFPALIDVAPELALEPLSKDILDPTRIISADIVAKMPRASLRHLASQLLATISEMFKAAKRETFRIDRKVELLALVADGGVRREVRLLYDTHARSLDSTARNSLLRYMLRWDPEEGTRRTSAAIEPGSDTSALWSLASSGPIPALSSILRDRLFDRDLPMAAQAAVLLARDGRPDDRDAIQSRLRQWRLDRQPRLTNTEPLTAADGSFESEMVRALADSPHWKLPTSDRDRLLTECLTEACKAALRQR